MLKYISLPRASSRLVSCRRVASDAKRRAQDSQFNVIPYSFRVGPVPFPDDYAGFVADTRITFHYLKPSRDQEAFLVFRGSSSDTEIVIPIQLTQAGTGSIGFGPFGPVVTTIIKIADAPSSGMSYSLPLVHAVGDRDWNNPLDTNRFDHVSLVVPAGNEIELTSVQIVLNSVEIGSKAYAAPVRVVGWSEVPFDEIIRVGRRAYLQRQHWYRLPWSPMLENAANDIGQAASPRYGPWHETDYSDDTVVPWCSEYFCWLLGETSNFAFDWNPLRVSRSAEQVASRFLETKATRFIDATNTRYRDLGDTVQAGDYVKVKRSAHSTAFVTWCDQDGTPQPFDPGAGENWFLAIGGNQFSTGGGPGTNVVQVSKYRLADGSAGQFDTEYPTNWPEIVWSPSDRYTGHGEWEIVKNDPRYSDSYNYKQDFVLLDGFGDVHTLLASVRLIRHPAPELIDLRPLSKRFGADLRFVHDPISIPQTPKRGLISFRYRGDRT